MLQILQQANSPALTPKNEKSKLLHCNNLLKSGNPDSNWEPRVPQTRTLTICAIARCFLGSKKNSSTPNGDGSIYALSA